MQELITSYLLQKREAVLPGIGLFSTVSKPAEIDKTNSKILPVADEYLFVQDSSHSSAGLVKYIAGKKNINTDVAENELKLFCDDWKQKIDSGLEFCLETFGCLSKDDSGKIFFKKTSNFQYQSPIFIEEIYQPEKDYTLISNDTQSISVVKDEYNSTDFIEAKTRPAWFKWAIILFAIGLIALLFHFYNQRYSTASSGNQSGFPVSSPHNTYIIPK